MTDTRQRFYFRNGALRGEIVRLQQTAAEVFSRHDYPPVIRNLLAELMAASVLLTATLKIEGRLSLLARGDGRLKMIMAECTHNQDVRALAHPDESVRDWPAEASLAELLGHGTLAITLEPAQGERYQGIVPLESPHLAGCLEDYFLRSEQIPTRIWLQASSEGSAGLLLQVLPGDHDDEDLWPRATGLADTLRPAELLEVAPQDILYRLYHEEEVVLPPAEEVRFACSCSRERTGEGLVSIGLAEAEDILAEQGEIRLICQFCQTEYIFTPQDVKTLFRPSVH
ncbi:MAG TPA: Hsp33 family molecular chaperone HslO [Fluviicoccus sp.]|nr:Hsp33 family molecular chaperone HslO [Fluviicoccus sp.]